MNSNIEMLTQLSNYTILERLQSFFRCAEYSSEMQVHTQNKQSTRLNVKTTSSFTIDLQVNKKVNKHM